jgi:hypothetical protein
MSTVKQTGSGKQVTNCNAPKNSNWRTRATSHYQRILELLRQRGSVGVRSDELYSRHDLYGVSPRNRVAEARAAGFNIETVHLPHGLVRYILHEDQTGQHRAPVVPSDSTTNDLPLFESVER